MSQSSTFGSLSPRRRKQFTGEIHPPAQIPHQRGKRDLQPSHPGQMRAPLVKRVPKGPIEKTKGARPEDCRPASRKVEFAKRDSIGVVLW